MRIARGNDCAPLFNRSSGAFARRAAARAAKFAIEPPLTNSPLASARKPTICLIQSIVSRSTSTAAVAEHSRMPVVPTHGHDDLSERLEQTLKIDAALRQVAFQFLSNLSRRRLWINAPGADRAEIFRHRRDRSG